MVEKIITDLNSSKAPGPDCMPIKIEKNCEPKHSYIVTELFNMCQKESCFPECCKSTSVVPIFKNVRERSAPKTDHPVSLLSVVRKIFGKLLNNMAVDRLWKCDLFCF